MADKANNDGADDYAAQLAELDSEQFRDGKAYLINEETGEDVEEPSDEKVGDREEEAADKETQEPASEDEGDEEDLEEGDEEDLEEGEEKPEAKDEKKPKNRYQKRIDTLTATVHRLEKSLGEIQKKAAAPKNADGTEMTAAQYAKTKFEGDENAPKKPDPTKFTLGEFDDKYRDAYDDYLEERRAYLAEAQAEFSNSAPNAAPGGSRDEFGTKLNTFVSNKDNAKVKGFDAAVEAAKKGEWPLTPIVAACIVDSEVGAAITAHLHQNPKLAEELAGLPDHQQAARFGKLEDKFLADKAERLKQAKKPSVAPKPISSARGGGSSQGARFDSENFEDVERAWNGGKQNKRG